MRNMSFFLTTQQFLDGTKDVTRRLGWVNLKPGEHFMAVEKAQGLKKGEKIRKLGECVCKKNTPEVLIDIIKYPIRGCENCPNVNDFSMCAVYCLYQNPCSFPINKRGIPVKPETTREGFPDLTPEEFVQMFCREMNTKKRPVTPDTIVNRIELKRV